MSIDITKLYPQYCVSQNEESNHGNVSIRSLGITTLLFDDGKTQLLFDANITRPNALCVFVGKLSSNEKLIKDVIDKYDINRLRGIFISHTHYDHVLDMPLFATLTGANVYGSKSTINVARGNLVLEDRLHQFAPDREYVIGDFTVKIIPSIHSKAKFYNNDLGIEVDEPISFPAKRRRLPEGGSYDFYVTNGDIRILIHPSCNYIPKALKGYEADVMFFSVAQMDKMSREQKEECYRETIGYVQPKLVIPVHWDNFFKPLMKANNAFSVLDRPARTMKYLADKLAMDGIRFGILPAEHGIEI